MIRQLRQFLKGDPDSGRTPLTRHNRFLYYGKIVGTVTSGPTVFRSGGLETVLICLRGLAFVLTHDEAFELAPFDALYVPPRSEIRVDADGVGCELLELAAPTRQEYPVQLAPFRSLPDSDVVSGVDIVGLGIHTARLSAGLTFTRESGPPNLEDRIVLEVEAPSHKYAWIWGAASGDEVRAPTL